jgi:hypothetical protein
LLLLLLSPPALALAPSLSLSSPPALAFIVIVILLIPFVCCWCLLSCSCYCTVILLCCGVTLGGWVIGGSRYIVLALRWHFLFRAVVVSCQMVLQCFVSVPGMHPLPGLSVTSLGSLNPKQHLTSHLDREEGLGVHCCCRM